MDRLERMEVFRRIVEAGSLTAAARLLEVSLPTVSRAVAGLEEDLEVELLRRSTRRVTPTEAGRRYYDHCVEIASAVERARAAVAPGPRTEMSLVVSAPVTLGLRRVAPILRRMMVRRPRLRIDLRLEERMSDFVADGVDVAIRAGRPTPGSTSIIARPLADSPCVLVASPGYLRRRGTPRRPADLADHDAVVTLSSSGPAHLWRLRRGEREHVVGVRGRLRCTTLLAIHDAALDGAGIARLPRWLVADALEERTLRPVLSPYTADPIPVVAVYRTQSRGAEIITTLIDRMREAMRAP